ncbi:MAG: hypothetical protein ACKOW9_03160 [Candidatus Paceibacterota bacterium]
MKKKLIVLPNQTLEVLISELLQTGIKTMLVSENELTYFEGKTTTGIDEDIPAINISETNELGKVKTYAFEFVEEVARGHHRIFGETVLETVYRTKGGRFRLLCFN